MTDYTLAVILPRASAAGATGPKLMPKTSDGFLLRGLKQLLLFKETTLAAGFSDSVSGLAYPVAGASAAPASGGRGLAIDGQTYLATGPLDLRLPWSVALGVTMTNPASANNPAYQLFQTELNGQGSQSGFHFWGSVTGSPPGVNDAMRLYGQSSLAGVASTSVGTPLPGPAKMGLRATAIATHDGAGTVSFELWRDGQVARASAVWDVTQIQGVTPAPVQSLIIGPRYTTQAVGKIVIDVMAHAEDVAWDLKERMQMHSAATALQIAGGR